MKTVGVVNYKVVWQIKLGRADTTIYYCCLLPAYNRKKKWSSILTHQQVFFFTFRVLSIKYGEMYIYSWNALHILFRFGIHGSTWGYGGFASLSPSPCLSNCFMVEWKYWMPAKLGPQDASSCTFIFKWWNFWDQVIILREVQASGELKFRTLNFCWSWIQRSFDVVKVTMHAKGIKYNMLFPAKL